MEEFYSVGTVSGVLFVLGGILIACYPKLVYGYRKWSKERQESFNIIGFARLLSAVSILLGITMIISSIFGYGDRIVVRGLLVYVFVIVFMDRLFYKKSKLM